LLLLKLRPQLNDCAVTPCRTAREPSFLLFSSNHFFLVLRTSIQILCNEQLKILCGDADMYVSDCEGSKGTLRLKLGPRWDMGVHLPKEADVSRFTFRSFFSTVNFTSKSMYAMHFSFAKISHKLTTSPAPSTLFPPPRLQGWKIATSGEGYCIWEKKKAA
jgi:hypothetical protein